MMLEKQVKKTSELIQDFIDENQLTMDDIITEDSLLEMGRPDIIEIINLTEDKK